jgi:polysaccharide biosynthesis/export protein
MSLTRFLLSGVLGLFGCALAACSQPTYPELPNSGVTSQKPGPEYLIGAGDQLNINVWRQPELSLSVPVRPDGRISVPLISDMFVAGKTSTQVAADIQEKLKAYMQDPSVTVIVTAFVGPPSQQVRVIGEAAQPKAIPYREQLTVLDVMIAVGGLTEFAAGNRTVLVRTENGKQVQYQVRLEDLVKNGDITANVAMKPGDVLVIPEAYF